MGIENLIEALKRVNTEEDIRHMLDNSTKEELAYLFNHLGVNILRLSIEKIKPYDKNPRKHSKRHIAEIARSIEEFGFTIPILIDENNEILAGHGRYLASKELGLDSVPCVVISNLSEAKKKAYRIADNKLTEKGSWDMNLLKLELEEITNIDDSFNLELTAFEIGKIDNILLEKLDDQDQVGPPPKVAKTKVGDVWLLGKHKIICGDSLKSDTYAKLLGEDKAHMVFSDPPYNVKVNGHVGGNGQHKHAEFAMASGEMNKIEFTKFLKESFKQLKEYTIDGSIHYICMDWRHVGEIMQASDSIYDSFKNICVWAKDNGGMGAMYRSQHEFIFVFKNGKASHTNNISMGSFGRYRTNVWQYAGCNSFVHNDDLAMHPTVKPVEMIYDAILDCSKPNEIILDNFLGSGSTLIACEKAKRICYGIELEPIYVDVAIERWQKLTKQEAILEDNNKTFNSMK